MSVAEVAEPAWKSDPPTEKQVKALGKLEVEQPEGMTKGQASDLIAEAKAGTPATEKQLGKLAELESRIGWELPRPRSLTEAQTRIASAKTRAEGDDRAAVEVAA